MRTSFRQRLLLAALLTLSSTSSGYAADDAFAIASKLYQAEQWDSAADAFDAVAQNSQYQSATRHQAQLYAGECLMRVGQYAAARQRYQLVRHRAPSKLLESQALFRMGEVAWLSNEHDEAARLLGTYTETYPHGASIDFAKKYLQQIAEYELRQADYAALDEAVGYERDGRFDTALATYKSQLKQNTTVGEVRAETLRRAALLHERLAQRSEAIELFRQYLAEYPHSKRTVEVMRAVAWNHVGLDQTAQASDQFAALLSKFPQSSQAAEAAYWLAQQSADENKVAQALELLERVLAQPTKEHDKVTGKALCLKCQLLSSQDHWADIESLVEENKEAVVDGQLRSKLDFWSAEAAFRLRNYNTARQRFSTLESKTIGIDQPWTAMIPLRRAQLAARRQQWTKVLKILDRMELDFPDFELKYEIDYLRGRALAGRGEMTAARRYYRRVTENPQATQSEAVAMARWMIGETYFHQRDYPRARAAYEQVIQSKSFPEWQSRAALQAGKCWELEQRWDEASRVYAEALDRWPDSFSETQLESRLRWAQNQTTQEFTTQNSRPNNVSRSIRQ